MKRLLLVLFFLVPLFGQNLQIHYEFRGDRQYVTSTLEQFTGDKLGLTYWFISAAYTDIYNDHHVFEGSATSVYGEFYRFFNIPKTPGLMVGIQYSDGLMIYEYTPSGYDNGISSVYGTSFGRTWMVGLANNVPIGKFHLLTSFWLRKQQGYNFDGQLTLAWGHNFANDKLTFNGFFDIWGEKPANSNIPRKLVLLTEPQLYYNINSHIAAGVKAQISYNFELGYEGQLRFAPTVALRWNF